MIIKKIYPLIISVIALAVSLSCTQTTGKADTETEEGQSLLYIKIEEPDIESLKPLFLSEFVKKIDYVQLETLDQCLLPPYIGTRLTKDFIFVESRRKLYQFDKEGKFIRQIGREGQGPGEYQLQKYDVDDVNNRILVVSYTNITPLLFDYDGKYLGKVTESFFTTPFLEHFCVGDGYFIYTVQPMNVNRQRDIMQSSNELIVYDYIGNEVTQILPNRYVCEDNRKTTDFVSIKPSLQIISKQDSIFYYHSFYNDTLYTVCKNSIEPYAVIDFGKYKYVTDKDIIEAGVGKMRIVDMYKYQDKIFMTVSASGGVFICIFDISSKQLTYHSVWIINDIDGNQNIDISGLKNKITLIWNPEEMDKKFKENLYSNLDKSKLKHPEQKEKFQRMLKENIEKEDNPILMILHGK